MSQSLPVLMPTRDELPGAVALFTTRQGGVSVPPYDSLNLGDHVHDAEAAVLHNRQRLREHLGVRPVFLQQVHGTDVVRLTPETPDGAVADACWTDSPYLACAVMVADCLPILFVASDGSSVAAAHAGWRGLAGTGGFGVIESLLQTWPAARTAEQRSALRVWLGPCIGPNAFEVGAEVRDAFVHADPAAAACFVPVPCVADGQQLKYWANLPALALQRLRKQGIVHIAGNDGSASWCTVTQSWQFFSHRRDAVRLGSTGRMAACIRLAGDCE